MAAEVPPISTVPVWLLGRLVVYELLLETLVGNAMAMLPESDSDRAKQLLGAQLSCASATTALAESVRAAMEDFLRKTSIREKQIRADRAAGEHDAGHA